MLRFIDWLADLFFGPMSHYDAGQPSYEPLSNQPYSSSYPAGGSFIIE